MSQGTLHWDDWYRTEECRRKMANPSVMPNPAFNGTDMLTIFWNGMRFLRDRILDGTLCNKAIAIKQARFNNASSSEKPNPGDVDWFGIGVLERITRNGSYSFSGTDTPTLPHPSIEHGYTADPNTIILPITFPQRTLDVDWYPNGGSSTLGYAPDAKPLQACKPLIQINFSLFRNIALNDSTYFPVNNTGEGNLGIFIASTIIHEICHVEGFHHMGGVSSTRYELSLNEIVEHALTDFIDPGFVYALTNTYGILCGNKNVS